MVEKSIFFCNLHFLQIIWTQNPFFPAFLLDPTEHSLLNSNLGMYWLHLGKAHLAIHLKANTWKIHDHSSKCHLPNLRESTPSLLPYLFPLKMMFPQYPWLLVPLTLDWSWRTLVSRKPLDNVSQLDRSNIPEVGANKDTKPLFPPHLDQGQLVPWVKCSPESKISLW